MNLLTVPTFATPDVFHVVIESPRGSTVKLKYEPEWEAMSISRPLPLGVVYPFDWGFVPSTRASDADPIDAFVLWDAQSYPGVVLPCRALGVLQVEQNRTNHDPSVRIRNDRVVGVPVAGRRERAMTGMSAMPPRVREELEHFALIATAFEGKDARIVGWGDAAAALQLIVDSAVPEGR